MEQMNDFTNHSRCYKVGSTWYCYQLGDLNVSTSTRLPNSLANRQKEVNGLSLVSPWISSTKTLTIFTPQHETDAPSPVVDPNAILTVDAITATITPVYYTALLGWYNRTSQMYVEVKRYLQASVDVYIASAYWITGSTKILLGASAETPWPADTLDVFKVAKKIVSPTSSTIEVKMNGATILDGIAFEDGFGDVTPADYQDFIFSLSPFSVLHPLTYQVYVGPRDSVLFELRRYRVWGKPTGER